MAKILTIHTTGAGNGEHWSQSNEYGQREIDAIKDPEGGNTKVLPTSIPSPFARFDLVKTAFAKLSKTDNLIGEPNEMRLVSEALDIGQIFFNYELLKNKVEIIKWDKTKGIDSLVNSPIDGHKFFGEALNLFLDQDGANATESGFNFKVMDAIYMLRYNDNAKFGIIGGTSPSTLFFSSPNDLSFVNIQFGDDKMFDGNYRHLHLRQPEFQMFLHGFSRLPDFGVHFPELKAYLLKSLDILNKVNNKLWQQIGPNAEKITLEIYRDSFTDLKSRNGDLVSVIQGFRLKTIGSNPDKFSDSEFTIPSVKYKENNPNEFQPLVLQDNYQGQLKYGNNNWNSTQSVPRYISVSWKKNERQLPGYHENYPWLTVSDFLEPYIIRLPFAINSEFYYDGNLVTKNGQSYLMPLTKDFFDFYNVEDLYSPHSNVNIKLEELAGDNLKVQLTIKLKQGEPDIVFERVYNQSTTDFPLKPDANKRDGGAIVDLEFSINFMPFVRIADENFKPIYKVQCVDRDINLVSVSNEYKLNFINKKNLVLNVNNPKKRRKKEQNIVASASTSFYTVNENFDYISVEVGNYKGILLPRFDLVTKQVGTEVFSFAVDFGTTTTHIEYKSEKQNQSTPFNIGVSEKYIAQLHKSSELNPIFNDIIQEDFAPIKIGDNNRHKFPLRTALFECEPNWAEQLEEFGDFNPAFEYEKKQINNDVYSLTTNLKWANQNENIKRVKGYLESLLFLIRNKVLLNGGNLSQTKLIWLYPLSMTNTRRNNFKKIWDSSFVDIISSQTHPKMLSESLAPYHWFTNATGFTQMNSLLHPSICIDIGGGTTDIVVFDKNKPCLVTSIRFASNSIFGDGFSTDGNIEFNGFAKKYKGIIEPMLQNVYPGLLNVHSGIYERQKSEDLNSFYFSLCENSSILENQGDINFKQLLEHDQQFRVIFLVFYTAIIYHLAKILKLKNISFPRYIAFSGNGSKVVNILNSSNQILAELTKVIFEKIIEKPYINEGLDILFAQNNPKQVSSKGAIKYGAGLDFTLPETSNGQNMNTLKANLLGSDSDLFINENMTYQSINGVIMTGIENELNNFFEILTSINAKLNLKDNFEISNVEFLSNIEFLKKELRQNLATGFEMRKTEDGADEPLQESLFFYPLVQGLNKLAYKLTQN